MGSFGKRTLGSRHKSGLGLDSSAFEWYEPWYGLYTIQITFSDHHLSYMEREEWKETSKPKNNCRANEEKSLKGCEDKDCISEVYS